ncbi:glutamate synthase-related protein [Thermodesulfobacteriota bacterium]
MAQYICEVCNFIYDEAKEGIPWEDLPDDWECPVCGSSKKYFSRLNDAPIEEKPSAPPKEETAPEDISINLKKTTSDTEDDFADIHEMAETGESVYEPMRTKKPTVSWDDVLFKGAQLATIPLNLDDPVNTQTIIGPRAAKPLVIETPVYVTHMSFGALSKEAKIALAKGTAAVKTASCSGEGGILPEEMVNTYKYIFEFVPNQYSVTEEVLTRVDAIEIKFGQSAKPGMGGHLPALKVTDEIAKIRGSQAGKDIISPSHFKDIKSKDDLKKKLGWLRDVSEGKPVGIKLAAGHIEADMAIALHADPDFITIDGRAGGTGSSPKFIKAATSIPTLFALLRARRVLQGRKDVSLVITGGLRVSSDFAKALAMGADAVAIGTAALIAIGCQQYRICNTGRCPVGIATQDPALRSRLKIGKAAGRLENYLRVVTEEMRDFARLTGKNDVHHLSTSDLFTTNSEISAHSEIEHV